MPATAVQVQKRTERPQLYPEKVAFCSGGEKMIQQAFAEFLKRIQLYIGFSPEESFFVEECFFRYFKRNLAKIEIGEPVKDIYYDHIDKGLHNCLAINVTLTDIDGYYEPLRFIYYRRNKENPRFGLVVSNSGSNTSYQFQYWRSPEHENIMTEWYYNCFAQTLIDENDDDRIIFDGEPDFVNSTDCSENCIRKIQQAIPYQVTDEDTYVEQILLEYVCKNSKVSIGEAQAGECVDELEGIAYSCTSVMIGVTDDCGDITELQFVYYLDIGPDQPGIALKIIDGENNVIYWRSQAHDPKTEWYINYFAEVLEDENHRIIFVGDPVQI